MYYNINLYALLKYNPLFFHQIYSQALSALIPQSVVGVLKNDSSNVVDLISEAYGVSVFIICYPVFCPYLVACALTLLPTWTNYNWL